MTGDRFRKRPVAVLFSVLMVTSLFAMAAPAVGTVAATNQADVAFDTLNIELDGDGFEVQAQPAGSHEWELTGSDRADVAKITFRYLDASNEIPHDNYEFTIEEGDTDGDKQIVDGAIGDITDSSFIWNFQTGHFDSIESLEIILLDSDDEILKQRLIEDVGEGVDEDGGTIDLGDIDDELTISDGIATSDPGEFEDAIVVDEEITVSGGPFEEGRVSIGTGFDANNDKLAVHEDADESAFADPDYDESSGVLTITPENDDASAAEFQQLFRNVTYASDRAYPDTTARNITFELTTSAAASPEAIYNPDNGHYYQWVEEEDISWEDAKSGAEDLGGYLATIRSQQENDFIRDNLQAEGWIGASDAAEEGIWRWVTGPEGEMDNGDGLHFFNQTAAHVAWTDPYPAPPDGVPGGGESVDDEFSNWNPRHEPDNKFPFRGGQDYAYFMENGLWKDADVDSPGFTPTGYIVEFDETPSDDPSAVLTGSRSVQYIPEGDPAPPTAVIETNETQIQQGETVEFESTSEADGEAEIVGLEWDLTGDGVVDSQEETFTHTFEEAGNYTVRVTVYDDHGASDNASVEIVVENTEKPIAVIDGPGEAERGERVQFDGTNSTDDIGIESFEWDFGDGSANTSDVSPTHGFAEEGVYTVALTVTDVAGNRNTTTHEITIEESDVPDIGNLSAAHEASGAFTVNFTSDTELTDIELGVYDTDNITPSPDDSAAHRFTITDFEETASGGLFEYTNTTEDLDTGDYTFRLYTADSADGDGGFGQQTNVTVTNDVELEAEATTETAVADGQDEVEIRVNATDTFGKLLAGVSIFKNAPAYGMDSDAVSWTVDPTAPGQTTGEAGYVVFTATSTEPGEIDLNFTTNPTSNNVTVTFTSEEATELKIETEPENTFFTNPIGGSPAVTVTDSEGDPAPGVDVTVSLDDGDFASGTTETATNTSGIATFDDLRIDEAGSYQLEFGVDGADENVTSATFEIRAEPDCGAVSFATVDGVRQISDAEQLQCISDDLDADYELTMDINLSAANVATWDGGDGFEPIGDEDEPFTGTFDGDGNVIEGMVIDRIGQEQVGLFGVSEGDLTNVELVDIDVRARGHAGSLVGVSHGIVEDVRADGAVTTEIGAQSGGLVGQNTGTIRNATVGVTLDADNFVGGLSGQNYGTITDSTATGSVDARGTVGGLVGANNGEINRSFANGSVVGSSVYIGGLVGQNHVGDIVASSATGDVEGTDRVGGLSGNNAFGTITDSYSLGDVNGNEDVGGLVGSNGNEITRSYAAGSVTGNAAVGGLVGTNEGDVTGSYWDTEASDKSDSDGGTGLTTVEMTDVRAFQNMDALDFEETWNITADYPRLSWEDTEPLAIAAIEATNVTDFGGESTTIEVSNHEAFGAGITIEVIDDDGLSGIAIGDTAVTDSNGTATFEFQEDTVGDYEPDFALANDIDVTDSATVTIAEASTVSGLVTDASSGKSLQDVTVSVIGTDWENTTANDGTYELVVIDDETYSLQVTATVDGIEITNTTTVVVDGSTTQDLELWPELDGDGTEANPYEISHAYELQAMSQDPSANYTLVGDVDASGTADWNDGAGFEPVGEYDDFAFPPDENSFSGTFDGHGFTISSLTIDRPTEQNVGLFGYAEDGTTIENVVLTDATVTGQGYVGALVGQTRGDVHRAGATGNVAGSHGRIGGLVGFSGGTVSESYADVTVSADHTGGGLVGYSGWHSLISDSYALGDVSGNNQIAGLAGVSQGAVTRSYAAGAVDPDDHHYVGGLVGSTTQATGDITDSYWDTETSGMSDSAGGTPLDTAEMQGLSPHHTMDGFDFENTWNATEEYPRLDWGGVTSATVQTLDVTAENLTEGDTGTVTVTAIRNGDDVGAGAVIEIVDNDGLSGITSGETNVTNSAGTATFSYDADDIGTFEPTFAWAEDPNINVTATIEVEAASPSAPDPADFTVHIEETPESTIAGEPLNVTVTIENTGEQTDEQTIELLDATGTVLDAASVELSGGETATLTLTWENTTGTAGDHDLEIASGDDSATVSIVIEEPVEPPFFSIAITAANDSINVGDDLEVEVVLTNTGEQRDEQSIELRDFSGDSVDAQNVTLEPNTSTSTILSWTPTPDDIGTGTIQVASANESATHEVTVEAPPTPANFQVTFGEMNASVLEGDALDVAVDVENVGETAGEQTIELYDVNGVLVDSTMVALEANETASLEFVWETELGLEPGTITVASANETVTKAITVDERSPAAFQVTVVGTNEPITVSETLEIEVLVENVGELMGEQSIELLDADGAVLDSITVELGESESETILLTWSTAETDDGMSDLKIANEDRETTITAAIDPAPSPAAFDVSVIDTNEPIAAGDTLVVEAELENRGEEPGEQTVELIDGDGEVIDSATVFLEGGERTTVELVWNTDPDATGELVFSLGSDDVSTTGSIEVADLSDSDGDDPVTAEIDIEPRTLDFGEPAVGETVVLELELTNRVHAQSDLEIVSTAVVGQDPEDFEVVSGEAPVTLAPGETHTMEIAFTPTHEGIQNAQLRVISTAENEPQIDVWLSNTGAYLVVQEVEIDDPTSDEARVAIDAANLDPDQRISVNVSSPRTRTAIAEFEEIGMTFAGGDFEMVIVHTPAAPEGGTTFEDEATDPIQYIQIEHGDDEAAAVVFDETEITVRVDRSAVPTGDPAHIQFFRHDGNEWVDLEFELVAETDEYYRFVAETPGFSEFVVTAPETPPGGSCELLGLDFGSFVVCWYWWVLALIGGILGTIGYAFWRKRNVSQPSQVGNYGSQWRSLGGGSGSRKNRR